MDIRTALQVLNEARPKKTAEDGSINNAWRNDRNRRKAARRLLASGASNTSSARRMRRHGDVMRYYVTGIETQA